MSEEKEVAEYEESPFGQAKRWERELEASKQDSKKWRTKAEKITKRYLGRTGGSSNEEGSRAKLNLFTANTNTILSIMYGKTPRVSVDRKWGDPNDDVARVAGIMLERLLNEDIENPDDCYAEALDWALQDRLVPGMGYARVRYEADFEEREVEPLLDELGEELAPGYVEEYKTDERCPIEYVHWQDFCWSPARTWREVRWIAFKAMMTRETGRERFGDIFDQVPMKSPQQQKQANALDVKDPWERACVWEIWCKESKTVYWYVEGFDQILDQRKDPLGLPGFFPGPRPLHATMSTSHFLPFPDFEQAQDLYIAIDVLETRIDWLTKACKLVGLYDKSATGVLRMFNEAAETEMIPVDNWAMFAEKGGIKGQVDWLPIEQVANTISILVQQRNDKINLLYQATGLSDILRGQSEGGRTATEQAIKARYASTRIQALQDAFAKFATELQALKAHIIITTYDDQTIIERSNIMATPDAPLVPQALQLLRSRIREYKILVRPEDLAIQDYATLRQERSEALGAIAAFIPQVVEASQAIPGSMPYLLELMKWGLAGFRGAATIEGVLDQAIDAAKQMGEQQQQEEQPDPVEQQKLQTEQIKGQAEAQKAQASVQKEMVGLQTEQVRAGAAQTQAQADVIKARTDLATATTEAEMQAAAYTGLPPTRQ